MATWGHTTQEAGQTINNLARAAGGLFNPGANQTLDSVSIYNSDAGNAVDFRIAVYQGGTLAGGPGATGSEATLVHDFGVQSYSEDSWVTANSTGSPTLIDNTVTWIVFKTNDTNLRIAWTTTWPSASDFDPDRGREASAGITTDETVAWPDTWPTEAGSFSDFWYSLYFTYSASGQTDINYTGTGRGILRGLARGVG